jgi:hypothetical protein
MPAGGLNPSLRAVDPSRRTTDVWREDPRVSRPTLAPLLLCALLALPACGVVKRAAKNSIVRTLSGAVAGLLFGKDDANADNGPVAPYGDTGAAEEQSAPVAEEAEESADQPGGSGFYKVVEPNGTIRFVSRIQDVPTSQRTQAEKLAMERSNDPAKPPKRRTAVKRAAQQLSAAKSSPAAPDPAASPAADAQ